MSYEEIKERMEKHIKQVKKCPINDPKSYEILTNPNLLNKLINECNKKIVGEEATIKTILLCSFGRLVENSNMTSYNLMVNDESGAGKDFVTSNVLKILPANIVEKRTRISPKAFTYWHNNYREPEWTWDGKVCYLEDVSSGVLNNDVFKVMCSSGSYATIVKDGYTLDIEIKGKPVIIVTTYSVFPKTEMLRRFTIVNLDSSKQQTRAIMDKQLILASQGKKVNYDEILINSLNHFKRVKVAIPYALKLKDLLPDSLIMRTHNERFLDYIKASCALYQFQRDEKDGFLIATGNDYNNARDMLIKTTSNQYMIPLTKLQRKILKALNEIGGKGSVSDLLSKIGISDRWLRIQLDKLTEMGMLIRDKENRDESFQPVTVYECKEIIDINLPMWNELINQNNSKESSDSNNSKASNDSREQLKPLKPLNSELKISDSIKKILEHGKKSTQELIEWLKINKICNEETAINVIKKMSKDGSIFQLKNNVWEVKKYGNEIN